MDDRPHLNLFRSWSDGYTAMSALEAAIRESGLDLTIFELVKTRASQINGCAYCIDMHTKDARANGETEQRLYALSAWRETPFFTDKERAALAFTESVTRATETQVPQEDFDLVAAHWSPDEIGALVALIVTINAWTLIGVATRAWEPALSSQ